MTFDSLIFDLDGTLWDSSVPVTQAWNTALATEEPDGPVFSRQDIIGIMGLPKATIFEKFFPKASGREREEIASKCFDEEISLLKKRGAALYPGVAEGLEKLSRSFPLFLVSNCQPDYLELFFQCTGFSQFFKDSECHGNTGLPKADNIRSVIERNGLKNSAYIGDTSGDQSAARKAGATYFHVNYGFGNPTERCVCFESFGDLAAYFLP